MRNGVALAALAAAGVVNGLGLDTVPVWRQLVFVVLAVLAYLHGRHLPVRRGTVVLAVASAAGAVIAVVRFWEGVSALACLGLFVVLPRLAGLFRAQQAELVEAGRQRIAQLEREREWAVERARLRERGRIAADVHDSLGHELALIALRAGALELTADTERGREAAAELRASAVAATDRLRHAIGVLREGAAPVEPPDEDVAELVSRARRAGVPVTLTGAPGPLPALVDRAVHQVVREALTNATRHAPGSPVEVRLAREAAEVVVTVTNPLTTASPLSATGLRAAPNSVAAPSPTAAPGPATATPPGGSGLVGLTERVHLLGGTLHFGQAEGHFTVTARLPVEPEGKPSR